MGFWNNETNSPPSSTTPTTGREGNSGVTQPPSRTTSVSSFGRGIDKSSSEIEDRLNERFGKPRSALGPGTVVQGKLSFDTPVRIDGKLTGEIVSTKAVIIGIQGVVEAQLHAEAVIVLGKVKGDVVAKDRIEILAGGSIEGSIKTPLFLLEEGGIFNGTCSMEIQSQPAKDATSQQKQSAPVQQASTATGDKGEKKDQPADKDPTRPNPAMH